MGITTFRVTAVLCAMFALAAVSANAQTDVAASFLGAYSGNSVGNGVAASPSDSGGALFEVRHISNPLVGYEATYSYHRGNEVYADDFTRCGLICGSAPPVAVSANAHEVTADWLVSLHVLDLRPFALAGAGLLVDVPSAGQTATRTATEPLFDYGIGVDWGILPHIGLRLQYRGELYKAPDLTSIYPSTGSFAHTYEPAIGVYFQL